MPPGCVMMSPTLTCLATWLIGIHGGHGPICPNQDAACNCAADCGTNRCGTTRSCPEAWPDERTNLTSYYVPISEKANYYHHVERSGVDQIAICVERYRAGYQAGECKTEIWTNTNIGGIEPGKTPTECAALCDEADGCAGFELGVVCDGLCADASWTPKHQAGDCQLKNASKVSKHRPYSYSSEKHVFGRGDFYAKQDLDAERSTYVETAARQRCCNDDKAGCKGTGRRRREE